ncbi:hypothetical protein WA158_005577 [Blastocystis sp. Blastoise]
MGQGSSKAAKQTVRTAREVAEQRAVLKETRKAAFNATRMVTEEVANTEYAKNMVGLRDDVDKYIDDEKKSFYKYVDFEGVKDINENPNQVPVYSKGPLPKDKKIYDFPSEVTEIPNTLNKSQTVALYDCVKATYPNINYDVLSKQFNIDIDKLKVFLKYYVIPVFNEDLETHIVTAYRPHWTKDIKIE